MASKTLSPFPYYGGKSRMAKLICDMIDYNNTDIYIEPFGGAARVLLNKYPHKYEIYNDTSTCLCAFMRVMSNRETAYELINELYETEYSCDEFYRAMIVRNEAEDNFIEEIKRQALCYVKQLISKYNYDILNTLKKYIQYENIDLMTKDYVDIIGEDLFEHEEVEILKEFKRLLDSYVCIYKKIFNREYKEIHSYNLKKIIDEANKNSEKINNISNIKRAIRKKIRKISYEEACEVTKLKTANNHDDIKFTEMELAKATYIIFSQSRDGIGKEWSSSKYKSTNEYHKSIDRLYEISERLDGVQVTEVSALMYLLQPEYLDNERIMFYLDPSYLKEGDENKNLGRPYKTSFDSEDHEEFLKVICKAKSKILISNYDIELYNKYLSEENGWSRIEFETTTSVGGKKDNKRVEVLWYNY